MCGLDRPSCRGETTLPRVAGPDAVSRRRPKGDRREYTNTNDDDLLRPGARRFTSELVDPGADAEGAFVHRSSVCGRSSHLHAELRLVPWANLDDGAFGPAFADPSSARRGSGALRISCSPSSKPCLRRHRHRSAPAEPPRSWHTSCLRTSLSRQTSRVFESRRAERNVVAGSDRAGQAADSPAECRFRLHPERRILSTASQQ
jgi:hypothetical protein